MTSAKSAQTWREVCQQKLQIRRLTTRILNSKTTVCASRRRKTPRKRRTDGGRENTKVFCMIRFTQPKIHPDSCLTAISSAGCNSSFPLRFSYGSSLDDFRHDARCTSGAVWKISASVSSHDVHTVKRPPARVTKIVRAFLRATRRDAVPADLSRHVVRTGRVEDSSRREDARPRRPGDVQRLRHAHPRRGRDQPPRTGRVGHHAPLRHLRHLARDPPRARPTPPPRPPSPPPRRLPARSSPTTPRWPTPRRTSSVSAR